MMQSHLLLYPTTSSVDGGGGGSSNRSSLFSGPWSIPNNKPHRMTQRRLSATMNDHHNHYDVLGISPNASPSDIKKAFRLLAKRYHPDVSKNTKSDDLFKRIRLAYDILSNESTRSEYDRAIEYEEDDDLDYASNYYRWAKVRHRMQPNRWGEEEAEEVYEDKEEVSGSFIEVLRSVFLSLFLMQTVGVQLSLTFSSLMGLLDKKLDGGYKIGYLVAWLLGGRGGILLTICLLFAIWVCGKNSSNRVAIVVLAMWVGSKIARFAPFPQGALITLLYMSIKLQSDLK